MLKPSDKIITAKSQKKWVTASAIISFILILVGIATLILIQKPIQESQDLRQQASIDSGDVALTFSHSSGNTFNTGEEAQIFYYLTTNGIQVDGAQFVFNVVTDTLGEAPEFVLTDTTNLQIAYQQAEEVTDGYLISLILIADQIATPVSYTNSTEIGYIAFTPQSIGSIEFNFDVENSISTIFNSSPLDDQLTHIETLTYTVVDPTADLASPSPSVTASASPSPSPSITVTASPTPSPSPNASASPTVSPSPTLDTGTGVGGVYSCNESCNNNNECAANHRCYNGQCRLVTNVSSSTCATPSTADAGLNKSCNEYCADTRECASGYSCYFNRCRNPLNLDSTSCAAPSQQVTTAMIASCNQGCSTHKDCAANLLCHSASGTCRLATNPSSTSCTPSSYNSVSTIYSTKGGNSNNQPEKGIDSSASPTASSKPATVIIDKDGTNTDSDILPIKDETALGAMINYVKDQLAARNISLPILFIIIGLLLLLVVVVLSVLARLLGRSSHQSPIIPPVGQDRDKNKDIKYENKLADKINSLQEKQQNNQMSVQSLKSSPVEIPKSLPPAVTKTTTTAPVPTPSPISPPPQAATAQPQTGTSMMDRLKNKGISTPQNEQDNN